jgi:hypothetical protein
MNIDRKDWQKASGGLVEDDHGNLWRIAGFIDSPAVVLNPITRIAPAPRGCGRF